MAFAAARVAGLRCVLVLTTRTAAPALQGNLLLDHLFGATVHLIPASEDPSLAVAVDEVAKVAEVVDSLAASGERPYVVPIGGSSGMGAVGYVAGTLELVQQLADRGEAPTRLYFGSGSRGTQAGLELGARMFAAPYRVIGIAVSGGEDEKKERAARIGNEAAQLIESSVRLVADELHTDQGYIGEGYGIPTAGCLEAIGLLARTEGILLDPVYTGKAMAGLIDHVRGGAIASSETVVFLHTGGVPALFAYTDVLGPSFESSLP